MFSRKPKIKVESGKLNPAINVGHMEFETTRALNKYAPHVKSRYLFEYVNKKTHLGKKFLEKINRFTNNFYKTKKTNKREYILAVKKSIINKYGSLENSIKINNFISEISHQKIFFQDTLFKLEQANRSPNTTFERRVITKFLKERLETYSTLFNNLESMKKLSAEIDFLRQKDNPVAFQTQLNRLNIKFNKAKIETLKLHIKNTIDYNILSSAEFANSFKFIY
jgi:hypothetical protein